MEIIIGRDATTSWLYVMVDNTPHIVSSLSTVPKSISRQHCKLMIEDDGTMRINNLNPQNKTYVNGVAVMSKIVTHGDKVELGGNHYLLKWEVIDKFMPKEVDIRPLKDVWETYNRDTKAVTQRKQRFQAIRGITPAITMSGVLISYFSGGRGLTFILAYALIIVLTIFFVLKTWKDIRKDDDYLKTIKYRFIKDYSCPCPECGYFFGFTDYAILTKNLDSCPKCKSKLKK